MLRSHQSLSHLHGMSLTMILLFSTPAFGATGFVYTLNPNTSGGKIYGFAVDETAGTLSALSGFPVATGGNGSATSNLSTYMAVDRTNNRIYAINDSSKTVSAFAVNINTGALTAMPFSPITLTGASLPIGVGVHPSGSPLMVSDGNNNTIYSFNITATTATAAVGSPFAPGLPPCEFLFSSSANYMYLGNFSGNTFGAFSINTANGVPTALAGSPYAVNQNMVALALDSSDRLFINDLFGGLIYGFTTSKWHSHGDERQSDRLR